ncbi:sensor histidine kinase [Faecalispora anaeroviscerum]|uniref:sensor histidine kinase n=1 Tax=Faecalispora anaeroviscerum TaxID=2991836 RepID=UPI0024BA17AB|nr:ATP-binding protein [Faecalispora anaeroviscerum]
MKNKIAFKLTMYFSAALLLFSIIIGSVFMTLFKNHTMELHKSDLQKRAVTMAGTLSEYISGTNNSGGGIMGSGQMGYGAYLRFLDKIAMTDVWIVDENLQLITAGHMANQQYNYADLPQDAETVVKEVFQGKTTFSEGFSNLLNTPTLTVGTPIQSGGKVIGALLLHSPVEGMNEAVSQGFGVLAISISVALVLSILLSIVLAVAFTKPLKKMKNSAMQLACGDYCVKTNVLQKDEIGELAATIDILSERLDLASRESERLNKLRRDFVANISHELRTPVTVIRGSLEALCDEVVTDPEQVKSYHRQMLNESMFLQRLVNDLLDLSRLQNTDFKIEMQEISLCDVLSDVVRSARHMAQLKNVEIRQEHDTQMCAAFGDYGRLRQMFLIILDNAIKFSPQGGAVTVSLKDKTVSIRDNGIGIAQEDLPYIFDRFYQVKSEENKSGTGLGLAIAKQIADRHNIRILVNNRQNEGTEFQFQF